MVDAELDLHERIGVEVLRAVRAEGHLVQRLFHDVVLVRALRHEQPPVVLSVLYRLPVEDHVRAQRVAHRVRVEERSERQRSRAVVVVDVHVLQQRGEVVPVVLHRALDRALRQTVVVVLRRVRARREEQHDVRAAHLRLVGVQAETGAAAVGAHAGEPVDVDVVEHEGVARLRKVLVKSAALQLERLDYRLVTPVRP